MIPSESGRPAEPTPIPTESGRSSSNPIDSMTTQIDSEVGTVHDSKRIRTSRYGAIGSEVGTVPRTHQINLDAVQVVMKIIS